MGLSAGFWVALGVGVVVLLGGGYYWANHMGDQPVQPGPAMNRPRPAPPVQAPPAVTAATAQPAPSTPFDVWIRKGPVFSSGDPLANRKPSQLQVGDESLSFTQAVDGKRYTNTLTWTLPPETLQPGQEVWLTLSATREQQGASVGGWWNINCQSDGQGDTAAGSPKHYRLTGSPDPHSARYTFKFAPTSAPPYIQLSVGQTPRRSCGC